MRNNFNWDSIYNGCNLAFIAMYSWIAENENDFQGLAYGYYTCNIRGTKSYYFPHGIQWLYYFFDTQNISIVINSDLSGYDIYDNNEKVFSQVHDKSISRIEIEMDAFLVSFGILNQKLQ